MVNGGHHSAALPPPAPAAPPPAAPSTTAADAVQSKRDLTSWWKNFKRGNPAKLHEEKAPQGIFGVPLHTSIRYANVAISLFNEQGQSYIYGYVPIVVAKCGVFLKEKATDVEGIFRLSGSEKRIKELRIAFDSPDRYGKGLDWSGYTVHDAANILRRYFNQLPEPIIPLEFYQRFRDPLKNHQAQAVGSMDLQGPAIGHFDPVAAIRIYQALITELPPLNRQLLLYILDLLAVFASKSDLNKMTTPNLAAIFQPGLLSHPQHDMAPAEYRLSQDVLIFLIENQDSFLIGMHGTAADEKTVQEVQSGAPTPRAPSSPTTPGRSKTVLGRTSSNASAGADSVRRFGNLRRNVSVSSRGSKRSKQVEGQATPTLGSPANSGGVHRSNTVPSKRPGAAASPRFSREKSSDPQTPSPGPGPLPPPVNTAAAAAAVAAQPRVSEESTPIAPTAQPEAVAPIPAPALAAALSGAAGPLASPEITSASSSEATTPLAAHGSETVGLLQREATRSSHAPLSLVPPTGDRKAATTSERSPSGTPTRAILDFLKPSPANSDGDRRDSRKPNKLQKKRIPGSALSSAQSSAHSLQHDPDLMSDYFTSPATPTYDSRAHDHVHDHGPGLGYGHGHDRSAYATAPTSPRFMTPQNRTETDTTLKPTLSPSHSFHSRASATDTSDADYDNRQSSSVERSEKKTRWRFSQSAKSRDVANEHTGHLGSIHGADQSKSTISSSSAAGGRPRRSFQDNHSHVTSDPESILSDNDERKKGPMSWIRSKLAERKERDAERQRPRSPIKMLREEHNGSRQSLNTPAEKIRAERSGGKSMDVARQQSPGPATRRFPPEMGGGVLVVPQAAVTPAPAVSQPGDDSAAAAPALAQPGVFSYAASQARAHEERTSEAQTATKHGQDQYLTPNTQA